MLSLLIAIPVGIAQAVRRNSIGDYAMTTLTFVLYAMPPFFLGIILIDVFALHLTHLPAARALVDTTTGARLSPTRATTSCRSSR